MKGGRARERFRAKQQHNRIVEQLNRLHSAGYTDDDIRAAGKNAWRELEGWSLVKDKNTGQWGYRDGSAPSTPGDPEAPGMTATPAWAQKILENSYTGPAGTTQTPTAAAPAAPSAPLQWWQRGTPTKAVTPIVNRFGNVTGEAGKTPYVPAWLGGIATAAGGIAGGPAAQGAYVAVTGSQNPQWWQRGTPTKAQTETAAGTGATRERIVDPTTGIPDFPMLTSLGETPPTVGGNYYGYGYGTSWKPYKRGGRGGRGGGWYSPRPGGGGQRRANYVPGSGLANWSIG